MLRGRECEPLRHQHAVREARRRAEPLARRMSSHLSLSSSFSLFLSLYRKSREGNIECLEKGLHSVCGSVIQRLGSLALDNGRDNRAQWPFSRWLGDDVCYRVSHLLGIGRGRGSVLRVKRHRKRIYTILIEGKTLAVCRYLPVCRDGGRIGPRLNNGGVDAKGSKFIAIRFGEPLQGKFRRSTEAKKRKGQPSSDGPDLQQQTTALLTHLWQNRTVHPQDAKDVRRKLLLDLLKGERFERTTVRYPCIVDHYIKTIGRLDNHCDGLFHGSIICDIDLDEVQGKPFSLRERA